METTPKKHMGLLYVALSAVFLFNPTVMLVDVLPDFIGYILLCVGLVRLCDLSDRMAYAARRFRTMIVVGIGEVLIGYLVRVRMSARIGEMHDFEYRVAILLFTFLPLVFRYTLFVPAVRDFFKGLDTLSERFGGDALCRDSGGKGSAIDRISRKTVRFLILQGLLSLAPELPALTLFYLPNGELPTFVIDWYHYVTFFRTVGFVLSLVAGIAWLTSFIRFMRHVLRENDFLERLHSRYCDEILTQTLTLRLRRVRYARILLCVGLPFTVSLRIGGVRALSSAVFAILVLSVLFVLGDLLPTQKGCRRAAWVLTAVGVLQQIVNRAYLQRYTPEAALYQSSAFYRFLAVRLLSFAEIALTLLLLLLLIDRLTEVIKTHTAVHYGTPDSAALSQAATERLHAELIKKIKICAILFVFAAILGIADCFMQLHVDWLWSVALLASITAIWNFASLLQELCQQIQDRYQPDAAYKRD
jgi:hypothetical protein